MIGPHDSVARVVDTAAMIDFGDVMTSVYDDPAKASRIAQELAPLCRVLLFTGEYPYELTRQASPSVGQSVGDTELTYIEHTAADLYRTIARLLVADPGAARDRPAIVVDVIDRATVQAVFDDVGLVTELVRLPSWRDPDAPADLDQLVTRHLEAHALGEGRLSLTCFGSVHDALRARRIPCARIEHTPSAITDALRRAKVIDVALEARERQAAVVMADTPRGSAMEQWLRARFSGKVISRDDEGRLTVHTSRRLAESALADRLGAPDAAWPDRVGVGVAESSHDAYAQAALALSYAQSRGHSVAKFENGTPVESVDLNPRSAPVTLATAASAVGLSPLALYRVVAAFRTVNPAQFTVQELAEAYGASARTVRRLVTRLKEAGLAEQTGATRPPGAGRPSPVYRVDLAGLLDHKE